MSLNTAIINGYLLDNPRLFRSNLTSIEKCSFSIRAVHRPISGTRMGLFDEIVIASEDEAIVKDMKRLKQYDLVEVKAKLLYKSSFAKIECPKCRTTTKRKTPIAYLYPISLNKRDSLYSQVDIANPLPDEHLTKHFTEISNEIYICGELTSDPIDKGQGEYHVATYPFKVRRTIQLASEPDVTIDVPWITTYGYAAERDLEHLQKGSHITVTGFLHSTIGTKMHTCEVCNNHFTYNVPLLNIVPYEVEYQGGHITDKMIAEQEEEMMILQMQSIIFNQ